LTCFDKNDKIKSFITFFREAVVLSTRRAADALGVSESSLKRWCDQGLIESVRTAGGHRRLEPRAVIEYARGKGLQLAKPELLGLFPRRRATGEKLELSAQAFCQALLKGDEQGCRFVAKTCHLAGQRVAAFGDQFVAKSFYEIGERWSHGEAEVYQERRACQICQAVLEELGTLLTPSPHGPMAAGGTPEGDPYSLPSTLASLVLRQNGWRAQSLGSNLPWPTLVAAVRDVKPKLFWLSVSAMTGLDDFVRGYQSFFEQVPEDTSVVVGGRALTAEIRQQIQYSAYCDNLLHLETFARSLRGKSRSSSREK
jgi:excisionase family DNA binding protein